MRYSHRSFYAPAPAVLEKSYPALIVLEEARGLGAPLGALAGLLAQTLHEDFGDTVIVIHIVDKDEEQFHPMSIKTDPRRVDQLWIQIPDDPGEAFEILHARIAALGDTHAYIFLDTSRYPPDFTRVIVGHLAATDLGGITRRLIYLTKERAAPPFSPGWSVLRTDLLAPREAPDISILDQASPKAWGLGEYVAAAKGLAQDLRSRLGGSAVEPQGEAYPVARVSPEWCRARLDVTALAARQVRDLFQLTPAERETFSRWARALTRRRVGIALGGSGSWGYAHVALMQQLCESGVPIDLVGGSSSGAVMGAYYCVLGQPGLELVLRRGRKMYATALMSIITSTIIDLAAESDFGPVYLEDLEVVLLPVATNLSRARAEVLTHCLVSSAVRASSSAPGVFAATITRSGIYVDGAVTDNVPVVLVERMGADLLLACNPLPPPPTVRVQTPETPLDDFLAELHPVNRLRDLAVSFALMFHDFGDCEEAHTRVIYDPPASEFPLHRTFAFHNAQEIAGAVKQEETFQKMIEKSILGWKRLARSHHGRRGLV